MRRFHYRMGIGFLGFGLLFIGAAGFLVMTLWNSILAAVIGVKLITYWQALGLLVLSRILFGGFRPGGGRRWGGGPWQGRSRHAHWKQRMAERFEKMTPEEREKMREKLQSRCGGRGWGGPPWETRSGQPTSESSAL